MANLALILGPMLALAVARSFGPLTVLPALAAAALGQVLGVGALAAWQRAQVARIRSGRAVGAFGVIQSTPTLASRLGAGAVLLGIAAAIAALALLLQAVLM